MGARLAMLLLGIHSGRRGDVRRARFAARRELVDHRGEWTEREKRRGKLVATSIEAARTVAGVSVSVRQRLPSPLLPHSDETARRRRPAATNSAARPARHA